MGLNRSAKLNAYPYRQVALNNWSTTPPLRRRRKVSPPALMTSSPYIIIPHPVLTSRTDLFSMHNSTNNQQENSFVDEIVTHDG